MKKISILFCTGVLMSALCAGFVACNKSQGTEPKDPELPEVIGISPVPVSDVPGEVAAFFKKNLPPRSDTYPYVELELEFDFGDVDKYDTVCLMINSVDEFKAVAPPSVELPVIDFEKYTLIIGQHLMGDPGYDLMKQAVDTESDEMTLSLVYKRHEGGIPAAVAIFYFWGLYPKLPQKLININIVRE